MESINSHSHLPSFVHSVAEKPRSLHMVAQNAIKNEKHYAMYADEKATNRNYAPTNGNVIIQPYVLLNNFMTSRFDSSFKRIKKNHLIYF